MANSSTNQANGFAFTSENMTKAKAIIARYPVGRQQSAMLPLLDLAQRQNGNWLPREAMDYIADMLEVPRIRAYEVATFYTMFNKKPIGENLVQICTTTPCWLRGSDAVADACKRKLGIGWDETSADGKFTLLEVECLGACVNAPMVQINDDYYEDLDSALMERILDDLSVGRKPGTGSQIGRRGSCAQNGPTSLKSEGK